MSEQAAERSFYREPEEPLEQPIVVTVAALVHLVRASHDSPAEATGQRDYILNPAHVPMGMGPDQMSILRYQVDDLIRNVQSRHRPDSHEAIRQGRAMSGQVVGWLGELAAHRRDLTTARSAAHELHEHGGFRNWQKARRLNKLIRNITEHDRDYPVQPIR